MIQKVVMIGAGNLATQLSLALHENGIDILQVYSKTVESAKALAGKLDCSFTISVKKIEKNADLYIFAVSDKALQPILDKWSVPIGNSVHTAGSIPVDIFENYTENYGVFYPLQTFSKERKVDFSNIPICIESNSLELRTDLIELAAKISNSVHLINSEQRKQLHLAAVFTCNFTNHMYCIGQKLLQEKDVDFELLKPLIAETAQKVLQLDPMSAQTGPAVRFDEEIMSSHEKALKNTPVFQKLYRFVSESIYKMHKSK
ncbi:DUF2520 domain-containing protein [Labilibaculum sp. K2S]|uniref:Rossmann-like and DUF2520 domain-containing protein n=1 Tax=Labilibaculum sp. K2S TaxID=3056386 RepID=UPI0025A37A8F|nr:Rossmann-like and DUF2520 domain-containing protein [Labilibaculum sp. K2S]MDM8159421.1 DUF2520 domain-containing protein [Labilibaculum sp. K2S]